MAKQIKFTLGGKDFPVVLGRKVSKDDLYGKVKRVVEKDGQSLNRGLLAPDGSLLARKSLSTVRLDTEGTPVEPEEVLHDGQPVEVLPSSFDESAPLEKQPIQALAGFCVSDVYPLENCELAAGLYSTWFAYRKGPERKEALVLVKDGEAFLFAGHHKKSPLVGLGVVYDFFDITGTDDPAAEDEDDELDFAMM
jgi:hypothetical protein